MEIGLAMFDHISFLAGANDSLSRTLLILCVLITKRRKNRRVGTQRNSICIARGTSHDSYYAIQIGREPTLAWLFSTDHGNGNADTSSGTVAARIDIGILS